MTTNNHTPQIFGQDADEDAIVNPGEWPDNAAGPARTGARLDEASYGFAEAGDPDGMAGADGMAEADDTESYLLPDPNPFSSVYPQGAGPFAQDGRALAFTRGPDGRDEPNGHPGAPVPAREPGYPRVPGYAPAPREHASPGQPGYPPGPGYVPDPGFGYPHDGGYGPGSEYAPDPGYRPGSGYLPDSGYRPGSDSGYGSGSGYAPDSGYQAGSDHGPGLGYGHDAEPLPPLEPWPGTGPEGPPWPPMSPPQPSMASAAPAAAAQAPVMPGRGRDRFAPPGEAEPDYAPETADSLTTELLLHGKRAAPGGGWRRSVYRVTGGLLRFGESAAEMRRRDLINRVRTPVAGGHHRIAVLSLKGGVGKTTTSVGLGATLATLRGDRVIAVDANPDRGTLSDKVRLETAATIRDLLNERDQVRRYADVRAFTSQAPSRLEVLASDRDPGVSVAFDADDYCDAARVLEHFYSICITDCGTGLLHSAMSGVLRLADQIVVVSSPSVDGARSASATLDWLEAHNCADLVRNGVVVLSAIRPKSKSTVDLDRLEHHFAARCRAVARIPYDPHLEEGAEVELELLSHETADAYLSLAAIVGDGLAWPRRMTSRTALP